MRSISHSVDVRLACDCSVWRAYIPRVWASTSCVFAWPAGHANMPVGYHTSASTVCRYNRHSARSLRLAISSAEIWIHFSNKIYGSNFIKQHSDTVMIWNYQNADCSLENWICCVVYNNFRHTSSLYTYGSFCIQRRWLVVMLVLQIADPAQIFR